MNASKAKKSPDGRPLKLTDADRKIISVLQVDGRRPYAQIAADVGVPESVVRYRVRRMQRAGLLQVVGIADPMRIGFDHLALVGVRVRQGALQRVSRELAALPETSYVVTTTGSFDLMIEVVCRDRSHFTELVTERLQLVDGVEATESFLVLEIHKMTYGWGAGQPPPVASGGEG